jgi:hypothetical protein
MLWGSGRHKTKQTYLALYMDDVINKTKYLASWMGDAIK